MICLEPLPEYEQFVKQLQLKQTFDSFRCFFATIWYICDKFTVLLAKSHQNLISFDFPHNPYSLQLSLTSSRLVQPFRILLILAVTGLSARSFNTTDSQMLPSYLFAASLWHHVAAPTGWPQLSSWGYCRHGEFVVLSPGCRGRDLWRHRGSRLAPKPLPQVQHSALCLLQDTQASTWAQPCLTPWWQQHLRALNSGATCFPFRVQSVCSTR